MELLCVGLAVCDILAKPVGQDLFERDTSILQDLQYLPGGDAYNVAVCAASLGIHTGLCARIGNDPAGNLLRESAVRKGVDCSGIRVDPTASTATSLVMVESGGERHFLYSPGANNLLKAEDIPEEAWKGLRHLHVSSAMLLMGLDGEGLARLFAEAHRRGITTSMDVAHDPDGLWLAKIEQALHHTDWFLPSLTEAQQITGEQDPEEIAKRLSKYPLKALVIKMSSAGCYVWNRLEAFQLPAVQNIKAVDTTGAGDCFVSIYLAAKLRGLSDREAASYASAGAGCSTQQMGAGYCFAGWNSLEEIRMRY